MVNCDVCMTKGWKHEVVRMVEGKTGVRQQRYLYFGLARNERQFGEILVYFVQFFAISHPSYMILIPLSV